MEFTWDPNNSVTFEEAVTGFNDPHAMIMEDRDLNEFQFLGTRSGDYREVLLEFDWHLKLWQAIFDAIVQPLSSSQESKIMES